MALVLKNIIATMRKPYMKRWSHVRAARNLDWIDSTSPPTAAPTGTKNGTNLVFTLSATGSMYYVFWRGIKLKEGVGYTISGTTLTMAAGYAPLSTDEFEVTIFP